MKLPEVPMFAFTRLSLARQYFLASFIILLCGLLIIGGWVGKQIEIGVTRRIAAVTALYVDSLIAHHLQYLMDTDVSNDSHEAEIDSILTTTPLGRRIVAYRIWGPDGDIIYSNNPALVGLQFPVERWIENAFEGDVYTEISDLNKEENIYEKQGWPRLIETYAPVRVGENGEIVAVIEFYQSLDELKGEIQAAQQRSWGIVGLSTIVIYLLLAGLVSRASNTIVSQQNELEEKVAQLTGLLADNRQLHSRVSRAAARATTFNERFLRRIEADMHDGPAQDLSLALLSIEGVANVCSACMGGVVEGHTIKDDFSTIQSALQSALLDMRAILAGLRLPEIEHLSIGETAERAIRDYKHKSGATVRLTLGTIPAKVPLSVKITLYRILQESLANGFRHAHGASQRASITVIDDQLVLKFQMTARFNSEAVLTEGLPGRDAGTRRDTRRNT
jgi:signal transduction histidine kinase